MSLRLLPPSAAIIAAALAGACSDDGKPCDPDQILQNRICIPKPEAGADVEVPDADADAEIDGDIGDSAAGDGTGAGEFGRTCVMSGDSPECAPPAPYCAVRPGDTSGYCTVTGCTATPTLCPTGWTCFDVGVVNFCLKPM